MPTLASRQRLPGVIPILTAYLICALPAAAAWPQGAPDSIRAPRRVVSFEHTSQELVLKCDVGYLTVKAYADNILHVSYSLARAKSASLLWGIGAKPANSKYRVEATPAIIRLAASQLAVSVDRKTAQLTFLDSKGNVLLVSKQYWLKDVPGASSAFAIHAEFQAPEDEAYYGLGEAAMDAGDQRGQTLSLASRSEISAPGPAEVPILLSSRKYGFVLNNPAKLAVTPGKDGSTTWEAESGTALSCFVIYGDTADIIYKGHQFLIGK